MCSKVVAQSYLSQHLQNCRREKTDYITKNLTTVDIEEIKSLATEAFDRKEPLTTLSLMFDFNFYHYEWYIALIDICAVKYKRNYE